MHHLLYSGFVLDTKVKVAGGDSCCGAHHRFTLTQATSKGLVVGCGTREREDGGQGHPQKR